MVRRMFPLLAAAALVVMLSFPLYAKEMQPVTDASHFSMKLDKKPLRDVAGEVYQQTGFRVVFDEKWNSLPVTGVFTEVSLEEFFRRAFRKQNTSLLINDKDKIVAVRFFGDKSFADLLATVSPKAQTEIPEEIADLHRAQREELQEYLRDPEAVDPMSGMKLTDIKGLHAEQRAEVERMKQNPETLEPVSGATLGELNQLHADQQAENDQLRQNMESSEPESGMSIGAIAAMHQAQRAELERMLQDPNTVDPTSGMTLAEIWERAKKTE